MEFRNTVNILGNRLEEKYSSIGFKYKKDERCWKWRAKTLHIW